MWSLVKNGEVLVSTQSWSPREFSKAYPGVSFPKVVSDSFVWTDGVAELSFTYVEPQEPVFVVPTKVSMYQARTALSRAGLLATVEAALASMPDQAGEEARIKWEYAVDVRREDALVSAMASILNLDSTGLDSLFTTASEII